MSTLRKLQGLILKKPELDPHVIESFGDEKAISLLKKENIADIDSLFLGIGDNWSDRYFYSLALSRSFSIEILKQWVADQPNSATAHLVLGARMLKVSWDARGYGRGEHVTEEESRNFFSELEYTYEIFLKCAELKPNDPTPYAYLIMVAVYLELDDPDRDYFFQEAVKRDPENWIAHMHRLVSLTHKWGGSHERMFEFARSVASSAGKGSLLPVLLIKAHSEYFNYLLNFEDRGDDAVDYIESPAAVYECKEAYEKSLQDNVFEKNAAIFPRINAASWFWLTQDWSILKQELTQLKGQLFDEHWRWLATEGKLLDAIKYTGINRKEWGPGI